MAYKQLYQFFYYGQHVCCGGETDVAFAIRKGIKKWKHALLTQIAIQLKFVCLINTWCIINHEMDPVRWGALCPMLLYMTPHLVVLVYDHIDENIGEFVQTNTNATPKCHLFELWWTAEAHSPSACTTTKTKSLDISLCSLQTKLGICSRIGSIVTRSLFSVVVSKWARLKRHGLISSLCSWR